MLIVIIIISTIMCLLFQGQYAFTTINSYHYPLVLSSLWLLLVVVVVVFVVLVLSLSPRLAPLSGGQGRDLVEELVGEGDDGLNVNKRKQYSFITYEYDVYIYIYMYTYTYIYIYICV